ncbi:DUF6492 family protein [Aliiglaciecola sp. CAU 1673]|uniref:DUF6492 family protein n=1 Tax=Aliiglaciecola sp. CAU 1673 TaxID=3032595 RepID=UPI0023D9F58E|nr:DUF6492 family protein [Aliiglaciecola sp. CAU 1673]MDF2179276.1 DUF6492 family protein [Aliiglaciecola sp. CAU 1673]
MEKIGAVLPLKARGSYDVDDLNRTDILFTSLAHFGATGFLGPFFVVVPKDEVQLVNDKLAKWTQFDIRVVSECTVVPQLSNYPEMRGWRKQQIIKLAIAKLMPTRFYLTFDADVICLKPLSFDKLVIDGKALLQYEQRAQHPKWWKSSARLLSMSPVIGDPDVGMTVTPAILAVDICNKVMLELTGKDGQHWVDELCSLHQPKNPRNWRISRFLMLKWTEYSLYYLCALKHAMLDKFHVIAGTKEIPQRLLVHESHPYEQWDPAYSFSNRCPGLFCVVGSKSGLSPQTVLTRVGHFIGWQEAR